MSRRHVFLIEMDDLPDAVLRVLGPFSVQDAALAALELDRRADRLALRVETTGLCGDQADQLNRRLAALPMVRTVGLGWRPGPEALDPAPGGRQAEPKEGERLR